MKKRFLCMFFIATILGQVLWADEPPKEKPYGLAFLSATFLGFGSGHYLIEKEGALAYAILDSLAVGTFVGSLIYTSYLYSYYGDDLALAPYGPAIIALGGQITPRQQEAMSQAMITSLVGGLGLLVLATSHLSQSGDMIRSIIDNENSKKKGVTPHADLGVSKSGNLTATLGFRYRY